MTKAIGNDKVGIRLSPWSTFQGMRMQDPIPQFTYLIKGLRKIGLAYLHVVESRIAGNADVESSDRVEFAVDAWDNLSPVFIAGGFNPASAQEAVDKTYSNREVVIVFGRYFISNPDLPFRIRNGTGLAHYDRDSFYIPKSEKGYIDYPFSREWSEQVSHL